MQSDSSPWQKEWMLVCLSPFGQAEDLNVYHACAPTRMLTVSGPCAGKKGYTKTIVRPRADQLTSTFTSAQLAYRYGFPILQEKSNRRARIVLHQCRGLGDVEVLGLNP